MLNRCSFLLAAALCAVLWAPAACVQAAPRVSAAIKAAVADSQRPEADRKRDAERKPAQTIAFAGIKPGDSVLELAPAGGYYTRILSKVIGPKGHLYEQSFPPRPKAPPRFRDPAARVRALAADPAYSNITVLHGNILQPEVPQPVDFVWTSDNYHDLHNVPHANLAAFDKAVFAALKPGGYFIVIDHAAAAGKGTSQTHTLHRIDPASVKQEVEAAGFVLAASSNVLRNPQDNHTLTVFDPAIRGKTDQFVFKFRKPAR